MATYNLKLEYASPVTDDSVTSYQTHFSVELTEAQYKALASKLTNGEIEVNITA